MFSYRTCSSVYTMTMMNLIKNHYANKPLQIEFGIVWTQESDTISHLIDHEAILVIEIFRTSVKCSIIVDQV